MSERALVVLHKAEAFQVPAIVSEDLEDLSGPAPAVVTDVIRLLKRWFGLQPQRISSPAAAPRHPTTRAASQLWLEKLSYLEQQQAFLADSEQKFSLKKQIEEAQNKISELGGYYPLLKSYGISRIRPRLQFD
jgi:hypothetical protein